MSERLRDGSPDLRLLKARSAVAVAVATACAWLILIGAADAPDRDSSNTIAFVRAGQLHVMAADGSAQRNLRVRLENGFPVWSPDGRSIAFSVGSRRGTSLELISSEGTDRRVLTREGRYDCIWPAWSPDATRLAFTRNAGCEGDLDIFVIGADGSARRRLTWDRRSADPAWSPDSETIAFRKFPPRLVLFRTTTGHRKRISGARPAYSRGVPSRPPVVWSADGRRIYYLAEDDALHVVNTNGSGDRNLTPTLDRIVAFAISPSWNEVAVAGRAGGGGREIYVLDTDGTNLRRLTDNGVLQDDDPQWSSDGRKIAFVRWGPVTNPEIFVMNADGTDQTNVSRHPAPDEGPAWQPAPHPAGSLPMTGLDVIAVALGGLALFASGVLIRAVELRRRPDLDG